jgi:hypothetical protein
VKVKKDILAAITFIATGLLFYVVQNDHPAQRMLPPQGGCGAAETVLVKQAAPKAELPILLDGGITKDS